MPRLVVPFKRGDVVEYVDNDCAWSANVGSIGVVVESDERCTYVDWIFPKDDSAFVQAGRREMWQTNNFRKLGSVLDG